MAYNCAQFKDLIEEVLKEVGLHSHSATALLLGTAAKESGFGTYLHQLGRGPAHGAFQIEEGTFNYLKKKYQEQFPVIKDFTFNQLRWDLRASIIMARLKYLSIKSRLPDGDDLLGMAKYWKQHYNTEAGSGTVPQFVKSWKMYVKL